MQIAPSMPFRLFTAIALSTASISLHAHFLRAQARGTTNEPRTFVIRSARVFDGDKFLPPTDVSVENGVIKAIGKNLKVAPQTKDVDATGDTLLPGLIDSHSHTWGKALEQALRECAEAALDRIEVLEELLVECTEVLIARGGHGELVARIRHLFDEEPPASIRRRNASEVPQS